MSLLARDRLTTTLFLAAAVHALILLGVTFSSGPAGKTAPGLEVLLVSDDLPEANRNDHARYLAQRTQRGSGNTRDLPTGSPQLAPPAPAGARDPRQPEDSAHDEPELLATTSVQPEISYVNPASPDSQPAAAAGEPLMRALNGNGDAPELVLRGDPATGGWLVADTQKSLVAPYLDAWRHKIERLGTLNYPHAAQLASSGAAPVIEVAIRADGRLMAAQLQRSSGRSDLDQAALDILKAASPFEAFPRDLGARYGSLSFAYQWEFVGGRSKGTVTVGTNGDTGP